MDLLKINSLTYSYPGASTPALEDVCCTVKAGEFICLTGDSGCGKTTLLLTIKGLLRGGSFSGSVDTAAPAKKDDWSIPAGLVFQNAESQILCTTVAEEVAFGPENLCTPAAEIHSRVKDALLEVGLAGCELRNVERFSAGQKQRLSIASVLSMHPSLLLLDEPTSQMDAQGKQDLCALLAALKKQGYTIIMAEHDPRPFAGLIDRYLPLAQGKLGVATTTLPDPDRYLPKSASRSQPVALSEATVAIAACGLCLSYPETGVALEKVTLRVRQGERLHLFGGNGAGKSSLLRCLAGLERPTAGSVEIAGLIDPRPGQLPGKVGLLFQNPARQLFAETVYEEVAFSLRRLGRSRSETESCVAEALALCGIAHLADRTPLTLSFGEQHRVALAAVLAPRPSVLLLDEPFAGLDFPQRLSLLEILGEMPGVYGTTILIASHDELPDQRWADRTLQLSGGHLGQTCH
jgi:energy-coupling factor transporter ATP-binding protein EcfA2